VRLIEPAKKLDWLGRGKRLQIDGEAEALQAFGQVAGERGAFGRLEVVRAEVSVGRAGLEHVIGRHKDGGGDRQDRLLVATAPLDPVIEGAQVAALHAGCGAGALDQRGLEPAGALAGAGGAAPAGAFVVARAYAGPGHEMSVGRKARHVETDLGEDHLRGKHIHAVNGVQELHRVPERAR